MNDISDDVFKVICGHGKSASWRLKLCRDGGHWLDTLSVSNNSSKNWNSWFVTMIASLNHCYWFRSIPAGKFHTNHFTDTKHPLGLNFNWFRVVPVIPIDFGKFRPVYQFQLVLKSNPINPSCHNTNHLKKRISSQQSSFSSSSVFLCVSSSTTFFLILVVAIFCPVQLFIVLSFVFCNIIFSFVSLHVTSLTGIWKRSYNSAFLCWLVSPLPPYSTLSSSLFIKINFSFYFLSFIIYIHLIL